ncbi:HNH endonuclease [Streptococcus sobrinus]|uniref:HNH endonuclease n=1 Tax=Streptococcus sobrinus TaxID=1310 RepID=UPI0002E2E264|nr:HNH endonuclease signature motif containing protein [Streptococcus sobrinus]
MDYRQCEYEDFNYQDILDKKHELEVDIDNNAYSNQGIHYSKISNKAGKYYQPFEKIYHKKCAYCGINTAIQSSSSFEIDHFINEPQKTLPDGKNVNHVNNLVFACRNCNQSKKNFRVNDVINELNPDVTIQEVFVRKKNYTIKINNKFKENQVIKDFYNKLKFSSSFRQLDYLLLNLFYMKDAATAETNKQLLELYTKLLTFRNEQPSLLIK